MGLQMLCVSLCHRVLVSLGCRDLWVLHPRELSSICVLCSCLFVCHVVCFPAWGRSRCRFVPVADGAKPRHRLQRCSLGHAMPAHGVLGTAGRSQIAAGSCRRWDMARRGPKRPAEDAQGAVHRPLPTSPSVSLSLDDSSGPRAAGLVRQLPQHLPGHPGCAGAGRGAEEEQTW